MTQIAVQPDIERYDSLDGLRAYAIIGIVIMHITVNQPTHISQNFFTTQFIPWFTEFTLLFMIVSGFSVCCGYFDRFKHGTIKANDFYKRRYQRLLPFFALMCLIELAMSPSLRTLMETFADLTLCMGMIPNAQISVIGVGWFIGVVMIFYIMFPFIVFLQHNRRRAVITFIISLLMVYIAFECALAPDHLGRRSIIVVLPLFLIGGLIYQFRHPLKRIVERFYSCSMIIALAATILPFTIDRSIVIENLYVSLIVFSLWVIIAIARENVILNNKFTKFISNISLEVYLCHMVVFRAIERLNPYHLISNHDATLIILCVIVLIGSIIFAYITKYYILQRYIMPYISKL